MNPPDPQTPTPAGVAAPRYRICWARTDVGRFTATVTAEELAELGGIPVAAVLAAVGDAMALVEWCDLPDRLAELDGDDTPRMPVSCTGFDCQREVTITVI